MTTDKRGISALLLQRQLGLRRYETAWLILHKLRRAMVNVGREALHGDVEIDDTWIGGPQPGLRGSRQLKGRKAVIVLVAVEKRGERTGRVRLAVAPDFTQATMLHFVRQQRRPRVDRLYRRAERLGRRASRRRPAHAPQATDPKRPAAWRPIGRALGGPGDREPATVAHRDVPRGGPPSPAGVSGRVCVPA
jgi:hypothetical protein